MRQDVVRRGSADQATHHLLKPLKSKGRKEMKKMANSELIKKVEEIRELEDLMEEVKANIESLKDVLKAEMLKQGTEEMDLDGRYIVRWTSQLASRFDTKRFKEEYKDLYLSFTKEVSSKRFSIA